MTTKRLSAAERPGMDFWWDKFCEEQGGITPIGEDEWFSVACDFAQWFARHTVEAGEQYFGKATAQARWIAVSERLPRDGDYVLACFLKTEITIAVWTEGDWYFARDPQRINERLGPVTHWMPLPDAPEGDQS